jgi:hypothetical protein
LVDGEDVTNSEGGFGAAIDELAGVHAFHSNEILLVLLKLVRISENDLGKGGTAAWIMHDVLYNSLDISFTFSEVQGSESSGGDSLRGVGLEDCATTTALHSDYSSHD